MMRKAVGVIAPLLVPMLALGACDNSPKVDLHNASQKDVAQALNCSVEAVKWHVFQGRKKLKEMMKDYL